MKTILIALALVGLGACDVEGVGQQPWETSYLADVHGAQSADAGVVDYRSLTPKPTPPPPAVRACPGGFDRLDWEPPWVLYCHRRQGAEWPADPCAPLRLSAANGDLIACE